MQTNSPSSPIQSMWLLTNSSPSSPLQSRFRMQTLHLLHFNICFWCKLFHLFHFNLCFWCKTLPSPPLQSRLLMQTLCDIMLGGAKFQGTENKENPGQLASEFSTCYHEHGFWHAIFQISVNSTVLKPWEYKKGRKNWTSVKYSQNTI
jgi:hypothetical protein